MLPFVERTFGCAVDQPLPLQLEHVFSTAAHVETGRGMHVSLLF